MVQKCVKDSTSTSIGSALDLHSGSLCTEKIITTLRLEKMSYEISCNSHFDDL